MENINVHKYESRSVSMYQSTGKVSIMCSYVMLMQRGKHVGNVLWSHRVNTDRTQDFGNR